MSLPQSQSSHRAELGLPWWSPRAALPLVVSELGADSLPLSSPGLGGNKWGVRLPVRTSQRRTWTLEKSGECAPFSCECRRYSFNGADPCLHPDPSRALSHVSSNQEAFRAASLTLRPEQALRAVLTGGAGTQLRTSQSMSLLALVCSPSILQGGWLLSPCRLPPTIPPHSSAASWRCPANVPISGCSEVIVLWLGLISDPEDRRSFF